ncbi:MAG TPA: glycosyltransferase [Solirubrobacteraceae bacterium]|nr:glycosyltransferase [Solirubrobacteraceae bacterium]
MRVLIFHGYLLEGTGSNVYNARLAAALVGLGHEVHLLCQDRHPGRQPFVDAVGDWEEGSLRVRVLREPVRCTVYRPDIGGLLPVYVADAYEGIEARTFAHCGEAEIERYLQANVAAVAELAQAVRPQAALANHLIMGPAILARGLAGAPYAVKVHGSALEYTVKPHRERFLGYAREGLAGAAGVLVGSLHTARSLWETLGDPGLPARTRLGPPGVDVHRFRPAPGDPERLMPAPAVRALAARLRGDAERSPRSGSAESAFARDDLAAAAALERLAVTPGNAGPALVAFVGKLIVSKGVDLLAAAWPLVLERVPHATLAVVGFGAYRAGLERLLAALAAGDLQAALDLARAGRALEDPADEPAPLRHLVAFLENLQGGARERYLVAARALPERVVLVGRLDHEELAELLPVCEALVVPSTFPEAFGMVAAEAAACGALPVSAAHSGLAEVSEVLAAALPRRAAEWLSFPVDDDAVPALAGRVAGWLQADPGLRRDTRAGLVVTARQRWSWEGVARGVLAAARGELDALAPPGEAAGLAAPRRQTP